MTPNNSTAGFCQVNRATAACNTMYRFWMRRRHSPATKLTILSHFEAHSADLPYNLLRCLVENTDSQKSRGPKERPLRHVNYVDFGLSVRFNP